ncbi:MAG: hypothetical protein ACQEWA_04165, partial [Sphaerochaetaceae bacterium]
MRFVRILLFFLVSISCQLVDGKTWRLGDIEIDGSVTEKYIEDQNFSPNTPLNDLIRDDNRRFRRSIYGGILKKIYSSDTLEESRQLTELFTQGLGDDRAEDYVLDRLSKPPFETDFFNERAKESILDMGLNGGDRATYIKVLGVVELNDPNIDLNQISDQKDAFEDVDPRTRDLFANLGEHLMAYNSSFWSALLVEARR